jgi:Domain of unknown function (DUF6250)
MKKTTLFVASLLLFSINLNAQLPYKTKRLLFSDNFETVLDTSKWFTEISPNPNNAVYIQNQELVLDVANGVTVWLKMKLKNNWMIEFDRTIPLNGGKNDRLSDFNIFWQATDPHSGQLFGRNPAFENYDSLSLYYIGLGGNTNTTTRFRKYQGNGEKTILQEYSDPAHLLIANKKYHCQLIFRKDTMYFYIDNTLFFTFKDKKPLKKGYFGFRTTQSRHLVDNFKLFKLK